jgi:hypothetical protein
MVILIIAANSISTRIKMRCGLNGNYIGGDYAAFRTFNSSIYPSAGSE